MIPNNYAEWLDIIDIFEQGNDDSIVKDAFMYGAPLVEGQVRGRFIKNLLAAIDKRLNTAKDQFQNNIGRKNFNEMELIRNLLYLRRTFMLCYELSQAKVIPEEEQQELGEYIIKIANDTQESLLSSVGNDIYGRTANIIKTNPVNKLGRKR